MLEIRNRARLRAEKQRLLGEALRRHTCLFNTAWYLRQLPEGECTPAQALNHFLTKGRRANLSPGPWLDADWYWQEYPDVATTGQCAFDHYALHGEKEGRKPQPDLLLDVSTATSSEAPPLQRTAATWEELLSDPDFRVYFSLEERLREALEANPSLFDHSWYAEQLPRGRYERAQAVTHFLTKGRSANLSPGPWLDPAWYWREYPDVAASGQGAFDHYALHGEQEGRSPRQDFTPRLARAIVPPKPFILSVTAKAWEERCAGLQTTDSAWLVDALAESWEVESQLAAINPEHVLQEVRGTHSTYLQRYVERVLDGFVEDSFLILVPHFMLGERTGLRPTWRRWPHRFSAPTRSASCRPTVVIRHP